MDPLQILRERGGVADAFIENAGKLISQPGRTYESVFLELGMSADDTRDFFAEYYQVPAFKTPEAFSVKQEVLAFVPQDSAAHYRMVPLFVEDDVLVVGASNPDDLQMRDALNFISTKNNIPFRLVYMLDEEVTKVQQFYTNLVGEVGGALENLESELNAEIAANSEESLEQTRGSVDHIEEDAPVTRTQN